MCVILCVCSHACEREECAEDTVIDYVWQESKRGTILMDGNPCESDRDLGWIDGLTGNKDACF